jgi:tRNA pseudouridine55 synthase
MDGILNIRKPSGPTSFSVVARIKRITNEPKVGHGGTLDPLASGVLPVFLGQATRLAEHLMEYPKTYRAEIELGVATDSYDAEGKVTCRGDFSGITLGGVEEVLRRFRGEILQTPPVYSALKHEGQPLYKLARQGTPVEPESRPTTVYCLELVAFNSPLLVLDVECSKGTYIRSLAHDMGVALGCGAHLKGLIRTAYGPFGIKDSIALEYLEECILRGTWSELVQPMDTVLSLWGKTLLSDEQVELVRHGAGLELEVGEGVARLRAYDKSSNFVALLRFDAVSYLWNPQKVFHQPQTAPENRPNP